MGMEVGFVGEEVGFVGEEAGFVGDEAGFVGDEAGFVGDEAGFFGEGFPCRGGSGTFGIMGRTMGTNGTVGGTIISVEDVGLEG